MPYLNPAFTTQTGKPLPLLFGYGNGSGVEMLTADDPDGNQYGFYIGFDGECDGVHALISAPYSHLPAGSFPVTAPQGPYFYPRFCDFHVGQWTPIGIQPAVASIGPDNYGDSYFRWIPTLTPVQSFSGICYWSVCMQQNDPITHNGRVTSTSDKPVTLQVFGIFRGARCRYFDANGNVTGYGFTTNPTWHMIEVLLRFKFKRQQPQIAGLTDAEKACFNWPVIVAHAARNDFILANGVPRFMGNYVFASDSTLATILETMLRCCRSFIDDPDGKIGFYGYDAVDSSFTLTGDHVYPGTFQAKQQDLTRAPNVFIPKFRDLNIPAQFAVISVSSEGNGFREGSTRTLTTGQQNIFNTDGMNPFLDGDVLYYGDSDEASANGDYLVYGNAATDVAAPLIWCTGNPAGTPINATGGYIGTGDSRFAQRAPTTVQHRAHQLARSQVAPGVVAVHTRVPVSYDLGNMTYDQANRLMKYQRASTLGDDVAGWLAPVVGSVKVKLEAVDANGNAFARMRPNQRFTLSDTVSPEFAGDYLIDPTNGGIQIIPPSQQEPLGAIVVNFRSYIADAYPDVSDAPDESLRTINSAQLPLLGTSQQLVNVSWTIQSTPVGVVQSDGTVTITIADLTMQILGRAGFSSYAGATFTGVPVNELVTLIVTDAGTGAAPTFTWLPGGPPAPGTVPANQYFVLCGTFISGTGADAGFNCGQLPSAPIDNRQYSASSFVTSGYPGTGTQVPSAAYVAATVYGSGGSGSGSGSGSGGGSGSGSGGGSGSGSGGGSGTLGGGSGGGSGTGSGGGSGSGSGGGESGTGGGRPIEGPDPILTE